MRLASAQRKVHRTKILVYCRFRRHVPARVQLQHDGESEGVGGSHGLHPVRPEKGVLTRTVGGVSSE